MIWISEAIFDWVSATLIERIPFKARPWVYALLFVFPVLVLALMLRLVLG